MEVESTFPADGAAFGLVKVGDGLLDDPADLAKTDDLLAASLRDDRLDPFGAQPVAEGSRVVAAIGKDRIGPAARASDLTGDRWDRLDQVLGDLDVGHIACSSDDCERQSRTIAGDVMFGA